VSTDKTNLDGVNADNNETAGAAVDLAVLSSYEEIQVAGQPDLIVELIDLYVKDAPHRMALMRDALATGNWLSLQREAHSLRGSSGNLGILQVGPICDELERAVSSELSPGVELLLDRLERELERVFCVFLAERQKRIN
jgi:hypothetical protein